ncbi:GGDEF domain-containing protein [Butyrivibrio sp. FCS006]|uniref:GGDEF domain-containing protein n=1 Tax=Butyrivibrio sp. FCS006 TaxID=1280684 RepID=UPI000478755C|nr:GGDEF domain-containing protein [Butyrivibrio sp. FCS006]
MIIEGWQVNNFLTLFILVMILAFQRRGSRVKTSRMFTYVIITTIVLVVADTFARIGENRGGSYILMAFFGNLIMFLLDPLIILFSVIYIDCWMDEKNKNARKISKVVFQIFATVNIILVLADQVFGLKWFFYFEKSDYFRGKFFMARAVVLALFMLFVTAYLVAFRKNVLNDYRRTLYILPVFALIGTIIQILYNGINTTYTAGALACLILFISFQSNDVNMDNLTGVLNRRGFDIRLEQMMKSSAAGEGDFTAVMLDIKNFREINESCGHEEGDGAIIVFADMLMDAFGEDCKMGRIDGVTFCVLLDNASEPEIKEGIRKVKNSLERVRKKCDWDESVGVNSIYEVYDPALNMTASEYRKHLDELMHKNAT